MRPLLTGLALLAMACSSSRTPTPTGPSGEQAIPKPPAAYMRVILPETTFERGTPEGFPISGRVVNWGETCAQHITGLVEVTGAAPLRIAWSIPDVLPPGASAAFRVCCGPLSLAGQPVGLKAYVRSDSGCP